MTKVDLITGFLGSGKTTFLKIYVKYLLSKSLKIGIIENDYGAVNVDMMLLSELSELGCEIETIAGACDYDCHKRRFKTKLIALGMQNFDRVIIEPSGIFDVDELFDILNEEPLDRWYEAGSVIAIADALEDNIYSEESKYLFASQIASSGAVILSKTQLAEKSETEARIRQINDALKSIKSENNKPNIIAKDWETFTDEDFKKISSCGFHPTDYTKNVLENNSYSSLYFMNNNLSPSQAESLTKNLFKGKKYGGIFRIKGFIKSGESWLELNATENRFELKPIKNGQDIIIVIGENLNETEIKEEFNNVN